MFGAVGDFAGDVVIVEEAARYASEKSAGFAHKKKSRARREVEVEVETRSAPRFALHSMVQKQSMAPMAARAAGRQMFAEEQVMCCETEMEPECEMMCLDECAEYREGVGEEAGAASAGSDSEGSSDSGSDNEEGMDWLD
jgi:hypothetical protein